MPAVDFGGISTLFIHTTFISVTTIIFLPHPFKPLSQIWGATTLRGNKRVVVRGVEGKGRGHYFKHQRIFRMNFYLLKRYRVNSLVRETIRGYQYLRVLSKLAQINRTMLHRRVN